jgi:excisionase family DNA binding protein
MNIQTTVKFLTTRQLARLWRVSEATIKRWADAGHLNYTRTVGGHRRFALEEVARFQSERGLVASAEATAAGLTAAKATAVRAGAKGEDSGADLFFEAVTECDERAATALLIESYLNGVELASIFDETVARAMRRVGTLWHGGEITVADEHLATRTAIRAIESLSISIKRRYTGGCLAVCCGVEAELHEVAVLGLQVLLEGENWRVRNLGGNTPFFALADAVARFRPALVCISATMHQAPERSARDYHQFRDSVARTGARVVLGGEGFRDEAVRRRFPADFYAGNFTELIDFVQKHYHSSDEG